MKLGTVPGSNTALHETVRTVQYVVTFAEHDIG